MFLTSFGLTAALGALLLFASIGGAFTTAAAPGAAAAGHHGSHGAHSSRTGSGGAAGAANPVSDPGASGSSGSSAGVAAGAWHPSRPVWHDNLVYVIGDSVLLGAESSVPAALKGWRVTMNCVESRRLPQELPVMRAARSHMGSVVVIQAGNNYIAGEDGSFGHQINQAMHILKGVQRVVWVTVAKKWPSRAAIDRQIHAAAHRWSRIEVANWAPIAAHHPSYTYDGLHLTPDGQLAMAKVIAQTVGRAPKA
jgi:hypothetical protein